jgi:hypothetical protein
LQARASESKVTLDRVLVELTNAQEANYFAQELSAT